MSVLRAARVSLRGWCGMGTLFIPIPVQRGNPGCGASSCVHEQSPSMLDENPVEFQPSFSITKVAGCALGGGSSILCQVERKIGRKWKHKVKAYVGIIARTSTNIGRIGMARRDEARRGTPAPPRRHCSRLLFKNPALGSPQNPQACTRENIVSWNITSPSNQY